MGCLWLQRVKEGNNAPGVTQTQALSLFLPVCRGRCLSVNETIGSDAIQGANYLWEQFEVTKTLV